MLSLIAVTVIKHFISMKKNRIINLIIAAPVTLTLYVAILYKINPDMSTFAAAASCVALLVALYQAGKIYDNIKASK